MTKERNRVATEDTSARQRASGCGGNRKVSSSKRNNLATHNLIFFFFLDYLIVSFILQDLERIERGLANRTSLSMMRVSSSRLERIERNSVLPFPDGSSPRIITIPWIPQGNYPTIFSSYRTIVVGVRSGMS